MSDVKVLMDALPPLIRVGGFDIKVNSWDRYEARSSSRWGEFAPVEQVIRIDSDIATASKHIDTVLHEIGHAIWFAYGIYDDDKEERIVSQMSSAWVQIWRDNPRLLRWLNAGMSMLPRLGSEEYLSPRGGF